MATLGVEPPARNSTLGFSNMDRDEYDRFFNNIQTCRGDLLRGDLLLRLLTRATDLRLTSNDEPPPSAGLQTPLSPSRI